MYILLLLSLLKVVVMRGGFDGWHARYHKEKDLIVNYEPSIWGIFEDDLKKDEEEEENPFLAGIPKPSSSSSS